MNPFLNLQNDCRTQLLTDPVLQTIPLLTEDLRDPRNAALAQLFKGSLPANSAGKSGLAALIITPDARGGGDERTDLAIITISVRVAIYELVPLNRSNTGIGVSALDAVWQVMESLHGWTPGPGLAPLQFSQFESDQEQLQILAYYVDFLATWAVSDQE